jgi:uncharacterized coiled-coil DUF342 family protein
MTATWVNPLQYPLAMLGAGLCLVLGIRVAKLPSVIVLPVSGAIAVGGAMALAKEPKAIRSETPLLPELQALIDQADDLSTKAGKLRTEATELLDSTTQVELLGAVQYACDRAQQLPTKFKALSKQLNQNEVLLSVDNLQQQLLQVHKRMAGSSGQSQRQLQDLAQRLQRNIALAQQGEDARQSQLISLSAMVLDASGVLQQLQTRLRTADLSSSVAASELKSLSDEFTQYQDNVDLLLS